MSIHTPLSTKSSEMNGGNQDNGTMGINSNNNTLNGNGSNGGGGGGGGGSGGLSSHNMIPMENTSLLYEQHHQMSANSGSITHIPMTSYPIGNSVSMENQQHPMMAHGGSGTLVRQHFPSLTPSQHQALLQQHFQQQLQQQQQQQYREREQQILLRDFSQPPAGQPFDKCPIICSLFALLCCPITYFCSLPALILSICSYTDYRVHDLARFRSKSDCARRLIITACLIGLVVVGSSSIMAFIYRKQILEFIRTLISRSRRQP